MPPLGIGIGVALGLTGLAVPPPSSDQPPAGYVFLTDPDGAVLTDPDGADLMEPA